MWVECFKNHGLNGLIMGAVVSLLFFVIKWTLQTTKDILKDAKEERNVWQNIVADIRRSMDEHNERARSFNENVAEAHKFQREEHARMISNLNEITVTLGRINGYKEH